MRAKGRHEWELDEEEVRPGGCSLVYKARRTDIPNAAPCALKAASPGNEASLLRESELLQRIGASEPPERSPVVPFLDGGIWRSRPFLVMPWFEHNLESWQEDRSILDRLSILEKACWAVDTLHRLRLDSTTLVHSDLKPSNFLVQERDPSGESSLRVILADLGASRHLDPWASSGTRTAEHTHGFAPPEQALPFKLPARRTWDLFALASTIQAVLAGQPPDATRAYRDRMTPAGRELESTLGQIRNLEREYKKKDWDVSLLQRIQELTVQAAALQRDLAMILDLRSPIYVQADRALLRQHLEGDLSGLVPNPDPVARQVAALLDRHLTIAMDPDPELRTTSPSALAEACGAAQREIQQNRLSRRSAAGTSGPSPSFITVQGHQALQKSPPPAPLSPSTPSPSFATVAKSDPKATEPAPTTPKVAPTPTAPPETSPPSRSRALPIATLIMGLLVTVTSGIALFPRSEPITTQVEVPVPERTDLFEIAQVPAETPFWMATTETSVQTTSPWIPKPKSCEGSFGTEPSMPRTCVSFLDVLALCNLATSELAKQNPDAGFTPAYSQDKSGAWTWDRSSTGYRLPTEQEWRFAAKNPPTGRSLKEYAWFGQEPTAQFRTTAVLPNPYGIYDLIGNAWEWAWPDSATRVDSTTQVRALGGALFCPAEKTSRMPCAASADSISEPREPSFGSSSYGFRMVRPLEKPSTRTETTTLRKSGGTLSLTGLAAGLILSLVGLVLTLKRPPHQIPPV